MLPVTPMTSVTTPATVDRGSKVSEIPNPINSTGHPSPQANEEPSPVLRHQHQDVQLDLQKVFLQFAILHPEGEGIVTFRVCKLCSENRTHSVSVLFQYGLVKHGLCGFLTSSAIPNFTLVTLKDKVNTIYMVWQIKIL